MNRNDRVMSGRAGAAPFATVRRSATDRGVAVELVLRELRAHNFGVLSTVDEDGAPDSAGVNYGVSAGRDLALYVMTRRHLSTPRSPTHSRHLGLDHG
jgi:hypothetical protein